MAFNAAVNAYDPCVLIKYTVPFNFFTSSVRGLGTSKHNKYLVATEEEEVI